MKLCQAFPLAYVHIDLWPLLLDVVNCPTGIQLVLLRPLQQYTMKSVISISHWLSVDHTNLHEVAGNHDSTATLASLAVDIDPLTVLLANINNPQSSQDGRQGGWLEVYGAVPVLLHTTYLPLLHTAMGENRMDEISALIYKQNTVSDHTFLLFVKNLSS